MQNDEKFRLSQITYLLHSVWLNKLDHPKPVVYETWCSNIMDQWVGISIIYSSLVDNLEKPSYARSWESELELHFFFGRSFKGIMNISFKVNFKIITRWYYVPTRLVKIYPDASPLCYRGCNLMAPCTILGELVPI